MQSDAPRHIRTAAAPRVEPDRRLSLAPMMARTDRHFRTLARLVSSRTLLYTEMVTSAAILGGDRARLLAHDACEHPLALQVGGSDPNDMAECARIAEAHGFDEINVNVGCPSDRVRSGRFGACLMAHPGVVARCVEAMRDAGAIPITVKTRIGVDDRDRYEDLAGFVETVAAAGCRTFVVHARKAWLSGLSPKENREIPPLRYDVVRRLALERPDLEIVVNGGIESLDDALGHLADFDGVMIGRAAYRDPFVLVEADRAVFSDPRPTRSRGEIVARYLEHVEACVGEGVPVRHMTRHLLGLYQGRPGARAWRRALSEGPAPAPARGVAVVREAHRRVEALEGAAA